MTPKSEQTATGGKLQDVTADTVEVTTDNTQESTQTTGGSTGQADVIESVSTINEDGIPVHWFIIGALVFGMIIPQPRFIRWLF